MLAICLVFLFVAYASAVEDTCVNQGDGELFEYPDDCSSFIICIDEEALQLPCADGKIFDGDALNCVRGDAETCERTIDDDDDDGENVDDDADVEGDE